MGWLGAGSALALSGCPTPNAPAPPTDAGIDSGVDSGTAARRPRNIVVIVTDDQRADTLGVAGNPHIQTPNLDALARRGALFANNFVTTAICPVSRASMLSGLYARRHGIGNFRTSLSETQWQASYPYLLRSAGYRLGYFGKWGVGGAMPTSTYDEMWGFMTGDYYPDVENPEGPHLDRQIGDRALAFIEAQPPDVPFCLGLGFKAPHIPLVPPVDLESLYDGVYFERSPLVSQEAYDALPDVLRDPNILASHCYEGTETDPSFVWDGRDFHEYVSDYYALITHVDMVVGDVMQALAARGFAEDTAIVYTSDNGFYLGERLLCGKWFAHEQSIRTPMIVYDPRSPEAAGIVRNELTLNVDVHPTILELAGIAPPAPVDGASLLPLVRGESPTWRHEFFYEHLYVPPEGAIPPTHAVRNETHKYIRYIDTEPLQEELYHLEADPLERTNLVDDPAHAATLDALRARHDELLGELTS